MPAQPPAKPPPRRFITARSTLLVDRFMTHFIKVGGVAVIVAVLGIFLFILWQVIPLFRHAQVEELRSVQLPPGDYRLLAIDEYSEHPVLVDSNGILTAVNLTQNDAVSLLDPGFDSNRTTTATAYLPERQEFIFGTADGLFSVVDLQYEARFSEGTRAIHASAKAGPFLPLGQTNHPLVAIAYGDSSEFKLAAAIQDVNGSRELHAATLFQERTLFGAGEISVRQTYDLTHLIDGNPRLLLVNQKADGIAVANDQGEVFYLVRNGDDISLRQRFRPFESLPDANVVSMDFLLGDVTLVLTNPDGENRLYSLFIPPDGNDRQFGLTKTFPSLQGGAGFYSPSLRNKAFLIGHENRVSLRYGTTEDIRWETTMPYPVQLARLSGKYDRIVLLDENARLHLLSLQDPHPEAGARAMFGRIWYEGASQPKYEWQSTGGSDDFEPKLSLVPLILGTLKGTLYAMLFAVPVALLAAIYTSQFAHPHFRVWIKPLMEIMASLPSVVLGFLAALWLAPLLETRVPSLLLMCAGIPVAAMVFGWVWSLLPVRLRVLIKPGQEFLYFTPLFLLLAWICWQLGPALEEILFVVRDPVSGELHADFRRWWPAVTGADFEQRNSLIVGFAMGFAVIPIIFTISEDSLSNVPATLRSGSLALGASRWQTALRVIVPTASAGIFSALMIGLGRAVGETMIVVMATGNTPIMDLNIFSGMRTLSANIAVELPEAPHHGTLYRTLFLGAMVLFIMTFLVNTLAEILRQRLREKYKLV